MEHFCRSCSRSGVFQGFDLSTISQISNVRIDDMLVDCTQQQISVGDSLPQQVCAECFTALNSAFLFRKLTQHSENGFRQMINSTFSAQIHEQSQNAVDDYPLHNHETVPEIEMPLETNESIFPVVGIKEEDIHLEDAQIGRSITSFEEALEPIIHPPEDGAEPRKKRSCGGPTTFACKDCGYISQNTFNFKRHQKNQKHSSFTRFITKRPLAKHVLRQYIEPSISKPLPKTPKRRKEKIAKAPKPEKLQKPKRPQKQQQTTKTLYRCDDCGYQNYNRFNFRRHQETRKHTKISTFEDSPVASTVRRSMLECRDCGIEFISNNQLKAHRKESCLSKINEGATSTSTGTYSSVDDVIALWKMMEGRSTRKRRKRKAEPVQQTALQLEPVVVKIELPTVGDEATSEQGINENA